MKIGRIVLALLLLAVLAVAAFLMLGPRPPASPPIAETNRPATPKRESPSSGPEVRPRAEVADLGSVLGLASLADCSQSSALASILEQMVRIDPRTFESRRGGPISVPGFERPLVPTFERTRETEGNSDIRAVTADLDLPGRWYGLAVTGLSRSFYEESDASSFEIRFAEPPERVRETLVRQGFRLPPVGEFGEVGEDFEISTAIAVDRSEGGAALTCATG